MLSRVAVWFAMLVLASGTLNFRLMDPRYGLDMPSQYNCIDYPQIDHNLLARSFYAGEKQLQRSTRNAPGYPPAISRRLDRYFQKEDIVKEHAKLVQDINSLKQVVFVAPFDDTRDYEDSIYQEIIETSTTSRPTTQKTKTTKKSNIPVILLGGASQKQVVRSQAIKFPKQTISLVGTSMSPVVKHPYPFVMSGASRSPVRLCMTSPPMFTTTPRPSLWQRLLNTLIPR